jgi:beta-phosphoglucomutase
LLKGLSRRDTLLAILKYKKISDKFSNEQIEKICTQKNNLYVQMLDSLNPNSLYPEINTFIQSLIKNNVKLAIASSSQNAKMILKRLNIIHFFDFLVDPLSIKNPKPAPDIYLAAAQGLHLSPSECIGIEDAIAGIDGLKSAKIFAVGIDNGVEQIKNKSNISFATPNDINLEEIITTYEKQK